MIRDTSESTLSFSIASVTLVIWIGDIGYKINCGS